jgi:hypothetical protein
MPDKCSFSRADPLALQAQGKTLTPLGKLIPEGEHTKKRLPYSTSTRNAADRMKVSTAGWERLPSVMKFPKVTLRASHAHILR